MPANSNQQLRNRNKTKAPFQSSAQKDAVSSPVASQPESGVNGAAAADSPNGTASEIVTKALPLPPAPVSFWKRGSDWIEANDRWLPLFILLLAGFTRYYRLDAPPGVVFDEFHFGRFTGQYHNGTYFFDIHPPLGKLTLYFASKAAGYDASKCSYANIQDQFAPDCRYWVLRATAAAFGTLTAPLLYWIVRGFGGSARGGLLTALLFMTDGLNTIESRLVLIDSQLIFWCAAALAFAQVFWRRYNAHWAAVEGWERLTCRAWTSLDSLGLGDDRAYPDALTNPTGASDVAFLASHYDNFQAQRAAQVQEQQAASPPASAGAKADSTQAADTSATAPMTDVQASAAADQTARANWLLAQVQHNATLRLYANPAFLRLTERFVWAIALGIVCGNCVSIKFTGLATPASIALECIFGIFWLKRAIPLMDLLVTAFTSFLTFSLYYYVHFALLPLTGDGDAFMHVDFQATLVGNSFYDPDAPKPGFWRMLFELNQEMVSANARIEQRHHWDSVWWEWPTNLRGVLYYSRDAGHTYTESVYLLGNPTVIWQVAFFIVVAILSLCLYARYRNDPIFYLSAHPSYRVYVGAAIWCLALYVLNLMPYMAVKRSCFIYHYMPALMYGEVLTGLVIDQMGSAGGRAKWLRQGLLLVSALFAIAGFLFFAPWIYAFPLTPEGHDRRRWLPRWD